MVGKGRRSKVWYMWRTCPSMEYLINHLTTDDAIWHCLTLVTRYQLVIRFEDIDFVLAKKGGIGGGGRVSA